MKKYILPIALLASIITVSFVKPMAKPVPVKTKEIAKPSCAPPTNLSAAKTGFAGNIVLTWTDGGNASQWSYGGYYNTPTGTVFFGYPTYVWPVELPNSGSATSITFRVTAVCTSGGSSTSAPYSRTF